MHANDYLTFISSAEYSFPQYLWWLVLKSAKRWWDVSCKQKNCDLPSLSHSPGFTNLFSRGYVCVRVRRTLHNSLPVQEKPRFENVFWWSSLRVDMISALYFKIARPSLHMVPLRMAKFQCRVASLGRLRDMEVVRRELAPCSNSTRIFLSEIYVGKSG